MRRLAYLPLVGIIVGSIAGLVFMGAQALSGSKALAIIVSITATLILTGAFLEKATAAHTLSLLVKYQSLLLIPSRSIPLILISAHAFSRFAAGSLTIGRTRQDGQDAQTIQRNNLIMATLGMLPLFLVGSMLFILLVPLLWAIRTAVGSWLANKNGGYTGARLLTTQHVVEVSFYVLAVVAFKFAFDIEAN